MNFTDKCLCIKALQRKKIVSLFSVSYQTVFITDLPTVNLTHLADTLGLRLPKLKLKKIIIEVIILHHELSFQSMLGRTHCWSLIKSKEHPAKRTFRSSQKGTKNLKINSATGSFHQQFWSHTFQLFQQFFHKTQKVTASEI